MISIDQLQSYKRVQLQSLSKSNGLKANSSTQDLLTNLIQHFNLSSSSSSSSSSVNNILPAKPLAPPATSIKSSAKFAPRSTTVATVATSPAEVTEPEDAGEEDDDELRMEPIAAKTPSRKQKTSIKTAIRMSSVSAVVSTSDNAIALATAATMSDLLSRVTSLEQDLATTRVDLSTTKSDLSLTRSDLASARLDLTTVQTSLASMTTLSFERELALVRQRTAGEDRVQTQLTEMKLRIDELSIVGLQPIPSTSSPLVIESVLPPASPAFSDAPPPNNSIMASFSASPSPPPPPPRTATQSIPPLSLQRSIASTTIIRDSSPRKSSALPAHMLSQPRARLPSPKRSTSLAAIANGTAPSVFSSGTKRGRVDSEENLVQLADGSGETNGKGKGKGKEVESDHRRGSQKRVKTSQLIEDELTTDEEDESGDNAIEDSLIQLRKLAQHRRGGDSIVKTKSGSDATAAPFPSFFANAATPPAARPLTSSFSFTAAYPSSNSPRKSLPLAALPFPLVAAPTPFSNASNRGSDSYTTTSTPLEKGTMFGGERSGMKFGEFEFGQNDRSASPRKGAGLLRESMSTTKTTRWGGF